MTATFAPAVASTVLGIQGPAGNGAPGTTTRGGTGIPSNTLGIDGDFFLDGATGKLYLRASGTYSLFMTLVGLTGAAGATGTNTKWTVGSGAPVDSSGNDGDLYLVTGTGDVYQRAAGHYTLTANIKGLTGSTGAPGTPGSILRNGTAAPVNLTGIDGDYYLNTTTGALFQRQTSVYTLVGNLTGPQGAAGATGNTGGTGATGAVGAPGSILRNGSGAPVNTTGIDGDYYLVNTTGALYQRVSGAYVLAGNLTGPQGPAGAAGPAATIPVATIASSGASQALSFAPTGDKAYYITVSQGLALTVTAPSSTTGAKQQIVCYLINPSAYPVSPPAAGGNVVYPNGTPNISGTKARIVFETDGNSTTIWGGV